MSLAKKAVFGVLWNFGEQLGRRGIGMVVTLLLARFLSPADYGLLAMMSVFLAVASSLMDSGFKQSLIRTPGATQADFNTAFYANLTLGVIAYLLLFIAAPFIAEFYSEPRLVVLIRVAAIIVLINSFQVVQSAILSRALNFKLQLQATLPAGVTSGVVAVGLAYAGWGVWALVAQMLASSLVTTIILWRRQGWRPGVGCSFCSLRQMYSFGSKLFLSGVLDKVFVNLYVMVIAKLFAASVAGLYFFADRVKTLVITQLLTSIQTVTFPALATVQNDNARLKAGYQKVLAITSFLLFPAATLLAALAEPVFDLLLPDRWGPAVVYLQLMCMGAVLYPLHSINLNILKIKGRSDLFLYLEIVKKTLAASVLFMSYRYGVLGILIGQLISSIISYIPNCFFSVKLIGYSPSEQMADILPGLALSFGTGLAVFFAVEMTDWSALTKLVVFGALGVALYLLGARTFRLRAYCLVEELVQEQARARAKR